MSNPIVDNIISGLESGLIDSAKQAGVELKPQVLSTVKSFLGVAVPSIERWVLGVMSIPQTISLSKMKSLLEDLMIVALIHGLTLVEEAEIEIDKTKNATLQMVTGVVSSAVGKAISL